MSDQIQDAGRVLYLFCVLRAGSPLRLAPELQLFSHARSSLSAVCGWASMREWSGPEAEERMRDLEWLTPRVMRHEAVIEAAMRVSPVLPARLGTLFSSLRALDRFFAAHQATIAGFLAETEGKEEWAVKGFLDRARAREWLSSTMAAAEGSSAASGAGYLRERRARIAAAHEINHWAAHTLDPIVDELRRYAAGSYQRSPGPQAAADRPQPILNLAFLVARENLAGFRRCVERATHEQRARGLELAMSGPWPPYSFCPPLEMPP
jgi:hypothetical protein